MTNNNQIQIPYSIAKDPQKAYSTIFLHEYYNHVEEDFKSINEGLRRGRIEARAIIDKLKQTKQDMNIPSGQTIKQ